MLLTGRTITIFITTFCTILVTMDPNELNLLSHNTILHSLDCNAISHNDFNILYMNIRSCRNKIDLIETLVGSLRKTIHVTWLYSGEIFNISGYHSFHCTRDEGRGGGVSIFVMNNISAHAVLNVSMDISNFLVVELPEHAFKVIGVYNPGRNVAQFVNDIEDTISKHPHSIVCGDFNINILNTNDSLVSHYQQVIQSNGFLFLYKINESYSTRDSNTIKTITRLQICVGIFSNSPSLNQTQISHTIRR